MRQIRLIGVDLDGTLLDTDKSISNRTYSALQKAKEQGVIVVPATGRPYEGIPANIRACELLEYIISSNGANIRRLPSNEHMRQACLTPNESVAIAHLLEEARLPYEVIWNGVGYAQQWVYEFMMKGRLDNAFLPKYIRETRKQIEDMRAFLNDGQKQLEAFFVITREAEHQAKMKEITQQIADVDYVYPAPWATEITARKVNKGEALLHIADTLGIRQEEVMAIGDSGNDIELLRHVGFPVAMGNAEEHIKQMSHFVTSSNDDHGVALAIERFVLQPDEL